ncbi:dienelactone hydrolase family protein [bacterium]|nr:dienelactone hydrolase family protein [bacterium]
MRKVVFLALFVAVSSALAEESLIRTVETSASPLQAYRALTEDWLYLQWSGAKTAAFGVAPEAPWRVTYSDGALLEGILKTLEPGQLLEYSMLRHDIVSSVRIDFSSSPNGTTIRVLHHIPLQGGGAMIEAIAAGNLWDEMLPKLTAYLDSRPNSYLVRPRGENQYPAVLLLHDRFGLTRTVRDFADTLALRGFVVLAVDMFRGDRTSDISQAMRYLELVREDDAVAAIGSGWRALLADSGVNRKRIGVVGFGYGGEMAMRAMTAESSIRCGVAWYPSKAPADSLLPRIATPLMIITANPAGTTPTPQAEALSRQLIQQGVRAEMLVIKAENGFFEPANGAAYSAAASGDAMRLTLPFLDRRLKL